MVLFVLFITFGVIINGRKMFDEVCTEWCFFLYEVMVLINVEDMIVFSIFDTYIVFAICFYFSLFLGFSGFIIDIIKCDIDTEFLTNGCYWFLTKISILYTQPHIVELFWCIIIGLHKCVNKATIIEFFTLLTIIVDETVEYLKFD